MPRLLFKRNNNSNLRKNRSKAYSSIRNQFSFSPTESFDHSSDKYAMPEEGDELLSGPGESTTTTTTTTTTTATTTTTTAPTTPAPTNSDANDDVSKETSSRSSRRNLIGRRRTSPQSVTAMNQPQNDEPFFKKTNSNRKLQQEQRLDNDDNDNDEENTICSTVSCSNNSAMNDSVHSIGSSRQLRRERLSKQLVRTSSGSITTKKETVKEKEKREKHTTLASSLEFIFAAFWKDCCLYRHVLQIPPERMEGIGARQQQELLKKAYFIRGREMLATPTEDISSDDLTMISIGKDNSILSSVQSRIPISRKKKMKFTAVSLAYEILNTSRLKTLYAKYVRKHPTRNEPQDYAGNNITDGSNYDNNNNHLDNQNNYHNNKSPKKNKTKRVPNRAPTVLIKRCSDETKRRKAGTRSTSKNKVKWNEEVEEILIMDINHSNEDNDDAQQHIGNFEDNNKLNVGFDRSLGTDDDLAKRDPPSSTQANNDYQTPINGTTDIKQDRKQNNNSNHGREKNNIFEPRKEFQDINDVSSIQNQYQSSSSTDACVEDIAFECSTDEIPLLPNENNQIVVDSHGVEQPSKLTNWGLSSQETREESLKTELPRSMASTDNSGQNRSSSPQWDEGRQAEDGDIPISTPAVESPGWTDFSVKFDHQTSKTSASNIKDIGQNSRAAFKQKNSKQNNDYVYKEKKPEDYDCKNGSHNKTTGISEDFMFGFELCLGNYITAIVSDMKNSMDKMGTKWAELDFNNSSDDGMDEEKESPFYIPDQELDAMMEILKKEMHTNVKKSMQCMQMNNCDLNTSEDYSFATGDHTSPTVDTSLTNDESKEATNKTSGNEPGFWDNWVWDL